MYLQIASTMEGMGVTPQQIRKQFAGQLHPLCKVAIMRMNPAVYKLLNMFMVQEKDQRRHQFYRILQRGLFRNSRGRIFKNFFWGPAPRPPFSLFACFIAQCLKLGSTIAMPSLYRLSCYWPAFHQAKVGLPPFPRR